MIVAPFGFITPVSGGGSPFDPATLSSLTGWWKSFGGSPWTPTESAGSSGANGNLSEATNPPTVSGAAASFDGVNDKLVAAGTEATRFSAGAGAIIILYQASSTAAANGQPLDDEALMSGAGGFFCVTVNNTGARAMLHSGGQKKVQLTDGSTGKHAMQVRWDGTNLEARIDKGAWSSTACGNMGNLTSAINIGCNYSATAFFHGSIFEIMTANTALTDSNLNNIVGSYFGL